ncbi:MAG: SusC/RagA family TonB-linked outer membrane protein [Chitinophagaceae bacterium]
MKLITFVLLIVFLNVSARGFTQNINIDAKSAPIVKIFKELKRQTGYTFAYSKSVLQKATPVTINVSNGRLEEVLNQVLKDQPFSYTIIEHTVVIATKKEPQVVSPPVNEASPIVLSVTITGKIANDRGEALPGATVSEKGVPGNSVKANEDGSFSINVASPSSILIISYVGFTSKEVKAGTVPHNITLVPSSSQESEIVVIGYGTQRKQAITGSVATAKLKTYEHIASNNIIDNIKGVIPGVNIAGTNTAGGLGAFTIRGTNSIKASSTPLIVVDGAIFRGTLNDIASSDIESFTVLKDASAAAVYGSRSANGVILIETKKGSGINGKPKFDINMSYGISNELKPLKVYDAAGYLQKLLDTRDALGQVADPTQVAAYLQVEEAKNYNATPNHTPTITDPHSLFTQTGKLLNTTVSYSQKTEKTQYYISQNVIQQDGVIKDDKYKHYSTRVNIETNVTDWFKVGVKAYYSLKSYPGRTIYGTSGGGSSSSTYWFSPYASLRGADGHYLQFPQTTTSFNSPYWQIPNDLINNQNNLNGILNATVKVPWVKGLSYNLTYSHTLNIAEAGSFYGYETVTGLPKRGSGDLYYSRDYTVLLDQLVKYNRTFGQHSVDLTLLYSTENYKTLGDSTHGEGFDNPSLGLYGLSKGSIQTVSTGSTRTAAVGEMARLTYGYANRYTLTGTVRRDGYSAFSANHKYATFPSVGANWNISNEKFMEKVKKIDNLALRASYGSNGNQAIAPYGTLSQIVNGKYYYNNATTYAFTQRVNTLGNSNLQWESVYGLNLGLDFSILKRRINGSIDWYSKYTKNLIFPLSIPTTSGFSTISSNLGKVGNKGIEIALNTVNITTKDFTWTSDIAFARNRNKIIHIYGPDSTGVEKDLISQGYFIGKSLGTIYDYQVTGMWQQSDKDNGTIMTGMSPGTYKLKDVNKDGKITSDSDRVFIGNSQQNYQWSFTNTFRYKEFSLMVYVYSVWGGNGYYLSGSNTPYNDGYAANGAINHIVWDYWTPTHTNAMFPRLNYNSGVAAYKGVKYFDRSFIKLQKISLTYDLTKYVKKYGINGMSFSLSADNIVTYAPHWKGQDPETNSGLTDGSIPSLRTFMGMIMFNF